MTGPDLVALGATLTVLPLLARAAWSLPDTRLDDRALRALARINREVHRD